MAEGFKKDEEVEQLETFKRSTPVEEYQMLKDFWGVK